MEYKCPNCSGDLVKRSPTGYVVYGDTYFCKACEEYFSHNYLNGWHDALKISPTIAALTTRLQEAEAMLREASKKLNEKYAYVALEWATPDVAQAHADVLTYKYDEFLKGGTN